jgi:F-type H+-transporting ATPase subunit delta
MAEQATLARPYSKAVFELAKAQGRLDAWARVLELLAAVVAEEPVRRLLDSPELTDTAKAQRLIRICGEDIDDRGKALINLLAVNKRLGLIGELREQFDVLKAQEEQVLDVEVVSAYELTSAQADMLREALQRKFQREVSMTSRVDTGLVGGALIRAGDTVIDGSVRGRLAKLVEALQRA